MKFYQRLKDLREDNDKSQEEIAALLNTSRQQYARWESGQWQMPIEHYKTLSRYYDVSIDYLAGVTETPKTLSGGPYRLSKKYKINQHGNITNNFN